MTPKSMYRTRAWIAGSISIASAAGVAVLVLIGLSGCSNQKPTPQSQPAPVVTTTGSDQLLRIRIVRPTREHLKRLSTPQPATVGAYEKTDLYARVAGYLDTFGQMNGSDGKMRQVDIGDRVAKGQTLAKLWVPELEQERQQKAALVDQAEAELGQAEASLTAAKAMVDAAEAKIEETQSDLVYRKSDYELYVTLVKERAARSELQDVKLYHFRAAGAAVAASKANVKVAQAKVTQATADVASAKAHLKVAQANLEHTVIMLNYATIKAPYDGVITRRLFDTGAFVQSAASGKPDPLFTIARVDRLRIIADIPEVEASHIRLGQTATLLVNASRGQQLKGKVIRFADALDSGTRTMRTEIELDGPAATLRPGTFGSVTILLVDVPDALMLPTSALVPGGKPGVLVVEDGKARRREVELGFSEGGRVQVIRGLTGDEQVIADGKTLVKDGQVVEVGP